MNSSDFININNFSYHWCGRFIAQSPDWIHMTRTLSDYELMLITEGELHIAADDREFSAYPGDYILMPPTENQHGTRNSFSSFYWLHFEYAALPADNLHDSLSIPLWGHLRSPERIIILMKQLQDSDRRYRSNALNSYLTGAILSEISLQMKAPSPELLAISKEQTCQDIREYISWHLGEPLKCSQIADYFGYNEKYLTTLFGHRFGISLKQYIIREKMERAKALLTESDTPVAQIGYQLGFADAHNFSHAFSAAVGMTPGEYRKTYDRHNIFDK